MPKPCPQELLSSLQSWKTQTPLGHFSKVTPLVSEQSTDPGAHLFSSDVSSSGSHFIEGVSYYLQGNFRCWQVKSLIPNFAKLIFLCWKRMKEWKKQKNKRKKEKKKEIEKRRKNKKQPGLLSTYTNIWLHVRVIWFLSLCVVFSICRTGSEVCILVYMLVLAYVCSLLDPIPFIHPLNVPVTMEKQQYS